jgi:hypothetical protein
VARVLDLLSIRPATLPALTSAAASADTQTMDVSAYAAMQVQAMVLGSARQYVEQLQASPLPASAPPAQHADAILQLSAAAQSLLTR